MNHSRTIVLVPAAVCFTAPSPGAGTAPPDSKKSVKVRLETDSCEIVDTAQGREIRVEDYGRFLVPGAPGVPAGIVSIAIPPGRGHSAS